MTMPIFIKAEPSDSVLEIIFRSSHDVPPVYLTTQMLTTGSGNSTYGILVSTKPDKETVDVEIAETTRYNYDRNIAEYVEKGFTLLSESIIANADKASEVHRMYVVGEDEYVPDWEMDLPSDYDRVIVAALVDKQFEAEYIVVVYYLDYFGSQQ